MFPLARKIALLVALLIGVSLAAYYTYQLRKQELRDWRTLEIAFKDVGGLKRKATVMLNGSPMGRVAEVRLYGDRHLVRMELDPEVRLYCDLEVEVVPINALGTVGLEIKPHSGTFNANLLICVPEKNYDRHQIEELLPKLDRVADGEFDLALLKSAGFGEEEARRLRKDLRRADHKDVQEIMKRSGLSKAKAELLQRLERAATTADIVERTGWSQDEAKQFLTLQDSRLPEEPGVLQGKVREALAGAPPGPGRRKELNKLFDDLARDLEDLRSPDSGPVGSLIFDPDRAAELDQALTDLDESWKDLDAGLARFENDASQTGFLSVESLEAASRTAHAFNETFAALKLGLRNTLNGEGTAGAFLGDRDFAHGFRDIVRVQGKTWRRARRGEGFVGQLVDLEAETYTSLHDTFEDLNTISEDGVRGEGPLGLLSSQEAGDDTRTIIRNVAGSLERLRTSPLIDNPEARQDVEDLFGNADDLLGQLRRGLKGIRKNFSDRTFYGAVFSVF